MRLQEHREINVIPQHSRKVWRSYIFDGARQGSACAFEILFGGPTAWKASQNGNSNASNWRKKVFAIWR